MKGEEMKGEKKSAALMLAHLISIAPEMGPIFILDKAWDR
jgi:hypothetical protein